MAENVQHWAKLRCCQLALSTTDLSRSHSWYQRALGFYAAGERRHREGDIFATVPGLPEASFDVHCLTGRQDFFQIEMFEFTRPRTRRLPVDRRRSDLGYVSFGLHTPRFDEALARIACVSGVLETLPAGEFGKRRVCLKDPDGILIELMEDDPCDMRAGLGSNDPAPAVASVTLSVPNLERVSDFWIDILGCERSEGKVLHHADHERLWGLEGAEREALVLDAGNVALEFVQYASPIPRSRPAGYLISDQGIVNVAMGSTDKGEFEAVYSRAVSKGFSGASKPWTVPELATVVYLTDRFGFSLELLHVEPAGLARMGFVRNVVSSAQ